MLRGMTIEEEFTFEMMDTPGLTFDVWHKVAEKEDGSQLQIQVASFKKGDCILVELAIEDGEDRTSIMLTKFADECQDAIAKAEHFEQQGEKYIRAAAAISYQLTKEEASRVLENTNNDAAKQILQYRLDQED